MNYMTTESRYFPFRPRNSSTLHRPPYFSGVHPVPVPMVPAFCHPNPELYLFNGVPQYTSHRFPQPIVEQLGYFNAQQTRLNYESSGTSNYVLSSCWVPKQSSDTTLVSNAENILSVHSDSVAVDFASSQSDSLECSNLDKSDSTSSHISAPDFDGMWTVESPQNRSKDDTPINRLARLARFNRISPKYELVDEKGPAHRKLFVAKVSFTLNGVVEEFVGEGPSIKSASHDAASSAIEKCTNLSHPPQKSRANDRLFASSPPVAHLNSLAVKMRSWADYKDSYQPFYPSMPYGPAVWSTSVYVCGKVFYGSGHSKVMSRNNAALKALQFFEMGKTSRHPGLQESSSPATTTDTVPLKGSISMLYERTNRYHQDVLFEFLGSEGPSHAQIHKLKCIVGDLETIGQGASKHDAKQMAAGRMLEKMNEIQTEFSQSLPNRSKTERKTKSNPVKVGKARPDYGKNINPVSRLYQLQQARNAPDPVFEILPTDPSPGIVVKEYMAIVRVAGSDPVTGVASSKKLAKRFAAENFLRSSGYKQQASAQQKSNLRMPDGLVSEETEKNYRRVKFDIENPESEDKQDGRTYRRRFAKYPRPTTLYPNESIRETIFEATIGHAEEKPDHQQDCADVVTGCSSDSSQVSRTQASLSVSVISTIAKEFLAGPSSATATKVVSGRSSAEVCLGKKSDHLSSLEYLCRIANVTLKRETFCKQGPHSEFVTVLTVGDPIESIGCGGGATEDLAINDAAWNLLNVISEQGDVREICAESNRVLSLGRKGDTETCTESAKCDSTF